VQPPSVHPLAPVWDEGSLPPLPAVTAHLYAIHYSQEVPENAPAHTPPISAIVVEHVQTCRQVEFTAFRIAERLGVPAGQLLDRLPELERQLLVEFFRFDAERPENVYLHWSMRKPLFGFAVLSQRARIHGLDAQEIPVGRCFDLASYLKRRYGDNYAPHPRLERALEHNGVRRAEVLDKAGAAAAWTSGEYAKLIAHLSGKVSGIAKELRKNNLSNFGVVFMLA
jgi:hypothetical protein